MPILNTIKFQKICLRCPWAYIRSFCDPADVRPVHYAIQPLPGSGWIYQNSLKSTKFYCKSKEKKTIRRCACRPRTRAYEINHLHLQNCHWEPHGWPPLWPTLCAHAKSRHCHCVGSRSRAPCHAEMQSEVPQWSPVWNTITLL